MSTATFIGGKAFKNLTTNQTYPVILKDGDYLFVRNNKDSVQKYHQKYFNNIMIPTTVPVAPPVLAPLTEQEMIDSISVNGDNVTFKSPNRTELTFNISNFLHTAGTQISCGIYQLYGINDLSNEILNLLEGNGFEDDYDELYKALIRKSLSYEVVTYLLEEEFALTLISSNSLGTELLVDALDSISITTTNWVNNPNSSNNIKLWVLDNDWE